MKFRREEELLGLIATSLVKKRNTACPTDEEFALYMERRLDDGKKKAMISHFVSCRECRERLTIPVGLLEIEKEKSSFGKFISSILRPVVAAPALAFIVVLVLTMNMYINSGNFGDREPQEKFRSADLIGLKQMDLTPAIFQAIRDGDEEALKQELAKELPPGAEISRVVVEDSLKLLNEPQGSERLTLILYANGTLKVKLQ